ncbi:unnamed protein product [Rotaria socialis]|uniref:EGF-like domain-containing protein n=2 Tax=Rotaria socialis TaxID=392032 RepID=A0A820MR18_9BILA|nr:unnamed protein product [Rotaria socialis]CAF4376258.1 unnamed protein product [Rotaria socialis]
MYNYDWSGSQCTIPHRCGCALNSLCINQSICICPVGKFGSQCYLSKLACVTNLCLNKGRCVPDDVHQGTVDGKGYTCICPQGYAGTICEFHETRIDLSFIHNFAIPESLFIHFIAAVDHLPHVHMTIVNRIPLDRNSLTTYTWIVFNIASAQVQNNYYLIILQEFLIISDNISVQIIPSQRCASIQELFDVAIINRHLLRRIKHYHVPCQHRSELMCFYDDVHLYQWDLSRHANCFEFGYNITRMIVTD